MIGRVVVDSSALLALVFREESADRVEEALSTADRVAIGAPTFTETAIVLAAKLGDESRALLSLLFEQLDVVVVPFTAAHGREAREAYLRYGRGRHAAALNFGDCLSYAVAKLAEQPLLFVGDDFRRTDIASVL
jgi:ribonuclease VapC